VAHWSHVSSRLLRQSRTEQDAEHTEPGHGGKPSRKTVATVAGLLLTAWFLPALSHQWQDRQRARELQAGLVTRIGRATTDALVTSQALVAGRLPHTVVGGFDQATFNRIDLEWQQSRAEIEAQIEAYFPNSDLRAHWRSYGDFVRNVYWLTTNRCFERDVTVDHIARLVPKGLRDDVEALRNPFTMPDARPCTKALAGADPTISPRRAYYFASREVLNAKVQLTREILRTHAAGFSTRPSDLLRDLLPGS
jgi:hypothetical protein